VFLGTFSACNVEQLDPTLEKRQWLLADEVVVSNDDNNAE
jgi:hypothetical protein